MDGVTLQFIKDFIAEGITQNCGQKMASAILKEIETSKSGKVTDLNYSLLLPPPTLSHVS